MLTSTTGLGRLTEVIKFGKARNAGAPGIYAKFASGGEYGAAEEAYAESLTIFRRIGDARGTAYALLLGLLQSLEERAHSITCRSPWRCGAVDTRDDMTAPD